jgi:hypothetical protein
MFSLVGPLQMCRALFVLTSSATEESRPINGGLYMIGGYGQGYFFLTWVTT